MRQKNPWDYYTTGWVLLATGASTVVAAILATPGGATATVTGGKLLTLRVTTGTPLVWAGYSVGAALLFGSLVAFAIGRAAAKHIKVLAPFQALVTSGAILDERACGGTLLDAQEQAVLWTDYVSWRKEVVAFLKVGYPDHLAAFGDHEGRSAGSSFSFAQGEICASANTLRRIYEHQRWSE